MHCQMFMAIFILHTNFHYKIHTAVHSIVLLQVMSHFVETEEYSLVQKRRARLKDDPTKHYNAVVEPLDNGYQLGPDILGEFS